LTLAVAACAAVGACKAVTADDNSPPAPPAGAQATTVVDAGATAPSQALRVLLYEKETEWFHPSNPVADKAMLKEGASLGWTMTSTKDPGVFAPATLSQFDVVVFLLTSGMTLDASQRDALQAFIASGRGYVGVHSASHTDYDSPFYNALVGASFKGHPGLMEAAVLVEDPTDPIVAFVPKAWNRVDEWYTFQERPEENHNLHILLSLDEDSPVDYPGTGSPAWLRVGNHPLAWRQEYGGGRSFYTALGHTIESWSEPAFMRHIVLGIVWAAGGAPHGP
jgi:type 1 glutamine amidotransferase